MANEVEIVRIPVKTASALILIEALQAARTGYLAAPACQNVLVLLNDASDEVAAVVTWLSAEAHAAAAKTPEAAEFFKLVTHYAAGRPEVRRYRLAGGSGK